MHLLRDHPDLESDTHWGWDQAVLFALQALQVIMMSFQTENHPMDVNKGKLFSTYGSIANQTWASSGITSTSFSIFSFAFNVSAHVDRLADFNTYVVVIDSRISITVNLVILVKLYLHN